MKFVKCNRNKIISMTLVLSVLMLTSISSVNLFGNKRLNPVYNPNNVFVQKIDDNSARVHSDTVKMSRSDFLFCKSENSNGTFQYDICDLEKNEKIYGFNSPMDITITDCVDSNSQLGAGVWALASGATGASALSAVGGILGGVGAAGTAGSVGAAVVEAGATSAANGLGFLAGAKLAGAVALAAAGPGVIIAGTAALAGLG